MNFITGNRNFLFILLLLAGIAPYVYLSAFAHPVADDLLYAHKAQTMGLIEGVINDYHIWNGRYFSNLLVVQDPIAFGSFTGYKIVPVIIILLTVISLFFFVRVLTSKIFDHATALQASLVLALLFLFKMPSLSEGIYWFTGSATYQLGNIVALWYLCALVSYCHGRFILRSRIIHMIVLTLLLICSIGFNEVLMLLLLGSSLLQLLIAVKRKSEHKSLFIYLFIITLACSAVMILAPGNSARAMTYTANHNLDLTKSFLLSIMQSVRFIFDWISSLPLWIASLFYFFINRKLIHTRLFSNSFYLAPLVSVALLFVIPFTCILPAYWGTGILGQHRTVNTAYFFFLICWFINLTVIFNRYFNSKEIGVMNVKPGTVFGAMACITMMVTGNGYAAITDIFYGRAKAYDLQMKARYELINSSAGDTVKLAPVIDPPATLFVLDITSDPDHWINRSYAIYFGAEDKKIVRYPAHSCR